MFDLISGTSALVFQIKSTRNQKFDREVRMLLWFIVGILSIVVIVWGLIRVGTRGENIEIPFQVSPTELQEMEPGRFELCCLPCLNEGRVTITAQGLCLEHQLSVLEGARKRSA